MIIVLVKGAGMEIEQMPLLVAKHKVALPVVVPRDVPVAFCFKQGSNSGHVPVRRGNVQILVDSCLPSGQCIHAPAAVDGDFNVILIEKLQKLNGIPGGHLRTVF